VQVEGRTTVPAGQIVGGAEAADAWRTAVDWARRAQGHELVGITERMLEIAVEHVKDRHQFGRPIGSFQAVKHRLAEALVALTAARLALAEAWRDDSEPLARVARVLAGRAQAETAAHCLQVCGGIGFTWEFPLRGYVRRGALVEALLGSWRSLRADVGRELVRTQVVPRLPAL
jgi:alkylation response protein AidB-like acyl-CoA dehydrogenase